MTDVLVVGELNADLIFNNLNSPPTMGKEVLAQEMTLVMGSSSAIFACNLSSIGASVAFIGKLGDDMLGKLVLDSLEERKVNTQLIMQSKNWQTGISVATCAGNDREMVTYAGAMEELAEKDITDEMLKSAKHLHVSSIFLQPKLIPGIIELFSRAKKLGLTTSLDPQFDPAEQWDLDLTKLLPVVDIFLPNHSEILGFSHQDDMQKAIAMVKEHANYLVVKDGERGAWLHHDGQLISQTAFLNESVVDVIGAGDSFDAGFIYRFLQKKPAAECLKFATAMGALNTTGAGGTGAFEEGRSAIQHKIQERFLKDFEL